MKRYGFFMLCGAMLCFCLSSAYSQKKPKADKKKAKTERAKSEDNSPTTKVDMKHAKTYNNLAEYLKGRAPGIIVSGNQNNGYKFVIRGANSTQNSNLKASAKRSQERGEIGVAIPDETSPLFVIDGTPFRSYETAAESVDLNDIKSVEIIKDGAGYGLSGANGVIVIKTKKYGD